MMDTVEHSNGTYGYIKASEFLDFVTITYSREVKPQWRYFCNISFLYKYICIKFKYFVKH
jgi:hypothetical protein